MAKKDEWVRVKSESELRAGMCVELRPCKWCGKRERLVLLGRVGDTDPCCRCLADNVFHRTAGICMYELYGHPCFCFAIAEGRLYRLSDSQLTDSEATQELERVR